MWLQLDKEVRGRIREIFHITYSGHTEVVDNKVVSDGATHKDLEALSVDKMRDFVGQDAVIEETVFTLFDKTVKKVKEELELLKPTPDRTEEPENMIEIKSNEDGSITLTPTIKPILKCDICGKDCSSKVVLAMHKGKMHKTKI